MSDADFKREFDRLTNEESDRKMDIEVEYHEKEKKLQDEMEELRVSSEQ